MQRVKYVIDSLEYKLSDDVNEWVWANKTIYNDTDGEIVEPIIPTPENRDNCIRVQVKTQVRRKRDTFLSSDDPSVSYSALCCSLPPYFVHSYNKDKKVWFKNVQVWQKVDDEWTNNQVKVYSDIIQFYRPINSFLCLSNYKHEDPDYYTIADNKDTFLLWCKSVDGTTIDMDPTKTLVLMELILLF